MKIISDCSEAEDFRLFDEQPSDTVLSQQQPAQGCGVRGPNNNITEETESGKEKKKTQRWPTPRDPRDPDARTISLHESDDSESAHTDDESVIDLTNWRSSDSGNNTNQNWNTDELWLPMDD